jgi:hypothetical protein
MYYIFEIIPDLLHAVAVVCPYNKTDVSGLQTFLRDKFIVWANNGNSVEEIWKNLKNIVHESIERFVPYKIIRKN